MYKYNTYIFLQLNHPGLIPTSDIIYNPSPDKGFLKNVNSKELTKEEILRIQD